VIGARTRLFHAVVGLGLAGASIACGSSTAIDSEPPPDAGNANDAAAPHDAAVASDTGSGPGLNLDAGPDVNDAGEADVDAWTSVPIK
jgi:hypothetical protein